ncbi:MAG: prolyl oligopeptidase family serine peptidase [Bacteroidota bacterium]
MKKITILILLLQQSLICLSQETELLQKIDFEVNNITLSEAFKILERQTNISFAYNARELTDKTYSWQFKKTAVNQILNEITSEAGLRYTFIGAIIVIKKASTAQNQRSTIQLEGVVRDEETGDPMSFAHLRIEGTARGTAANVEGKFRIVIPEDYEDSVLVITVIGYEEERLRITESTNSVVVNMKPVAQQLDEVVVSAKKEKFKVVDLLKEVIAKIPENYPADLHKLKVYYREFLKVDSVYVQFADAAAEINYAGYETTFDPKMNLNKYLNTNVYVTRDGTRFPRTTDFPDILNNTVRILESRVSHNLQKYQTEKILKFDKRFIFLESHNIGGGPLELTAFDHVKMRNEILSHKGLKKYHFALKSYKKSSDGYVYEISFEPKSLSGKSFPVSGVITIDEKSMAITRITYESVDRIKKKVKLVLVLNKKTRRNTGIQQNRLIRDIEPTRVKVDVSYFQHAGKYYLKQISSRETFLNRGELISDIHFGSVRDLVVTDLVLEDVDPIPEKEQFRYGSKTFLSEYPSVYNPEFWDNYSGMVLDDLFKRSLRDLEKTHRLEDQFSDRLAQVVALTPPVATKKADSLEIHHQLRTDAYAWLSEKYDEAVEEYLEKENSFTGNYMIPFRKAQRSFYYEMVDKVESRYEAIPVKMGDYFYGYRYEEGRPHEIYYRQRDTLDLEEEIVLDVNKIAYGNNYYDIDFFHLSPDHSLLAYAENTSGGNENVVRFLNITDQTYIKDSLINVWSLAWANDNKTILYTVADSAERPYQLRRHVLHTSKVADKVLYTEKDSTFSIGISKTRSKRYVQLYSSSKDENEIRVVNANTPDAPFQLVQERSPGVRYYIRDYNDLFFVLSDVHTPDVSLYQVEAADPGIANWKRILTYTSDTLIQDMDIIGNYLVLKQKVNMRPHVKVIDQISGQIRYLIPDSLEVYSLNLLTPDEGETQKVKYALSSPVHPTTTFLYDLEKGQTTVIKRQKVAGYDPGNYHTERLYAETSDGVKIPITLVYRSDMIQKDSGALMLKGYGAYGFSYPMSFSVGNLPFLDRGGIIAYVHVRGGGELGHQWYEAGKLLNKKNTFSDFITSAEYLIARGYGKAGELIAMGGSAGGLLMGVAINERPDLFKAVVLNVPFVDVVNTMLDDQLPLTAGEFKEWGNPKDRVYHDYIKSYSPYENVKAQDYPHLLFLASYNDANVGYWEAAKMVAKLRAKKTDENVLLLKTNMYAGHNGFSDRFADFKEMSFIYAFLASLGY